MNEEVPIVHQHPFGIVISLDAERALTPLRHLRSHFVADRLNLALVRAGTDHEVVSEGCDLPQIEHADVNRFLGAGGAHGRYPGRFFRRLLGVLERKVFNGWQLEIP